MMNKKGREMKGWKTRKGKEENKNLKQEKKDN